VQARRSAPRWPIPTAAACLAAALAGCGYSNPHPAGTYERALAYADHGKHREAVDAYTAFLRRSPTDSLAARAQLEKARSYFATKEYPLAAVELQILRQEYPNSDLLEEALFEEARAHLLQVGGIQRDVTPAREARVLFRSFLQTYPASTRADEARRHLVAISDVLALKQLGVVEVYRQLRKPDAMAVTLDRLIEEEPETTHRDRILLERARLALRRDDAPRAREVLELLLRERPDSARAAEARKLLDGLPAAAP
jgi:outer membrane protein assembly factor BamD